MRELAHAPTQRSVHKLAAHAYTTVPRRQWPRVTPTSKFFANNGFCEDGHPSATGKPSGEYYLRFAHACETDEVQVLSGTYGGCGKLVYVPCGIGAPPPPN